MRLHFYVGKRLAERVERVGAMLGQPKARAAAFLLDNMSQFEELALAALEQRLESPLVAAPAGESQSAGGETDEIVLMYVRLDAEVAKRIGQFAKQKALSQSKVCAWLLARAVDDDQWIVKVVEQRLAQALAQPTGTKGRDNERDYAGT